MEHPTAIPKEWIGRIVEVYFWDHCEGTGAKEILDCRVWGKLISFSDKQIIIRQWEAEGNNSYIALVRATIYAMNVLKCGE